MFDDKTIFFSIFLKNFKRYRVVLKQIVMLVEINTNVKNWFKSFES